MTTTLSPGTVVRVGTDAAFASTDPLFRRLVPVDSAWVSLPNGATVDDTGALAEDTQCTFVYAAEIYKYGEIGLAADTVTAPAGTIAMLYSGSIVTVEEHPTLARTGIPVWGWVAIAAGVVMVGYKLLK